MKKFRVLQALLVLFTALTITSCGDEPTLNPLNNGFSDSDMRVAFDNRMFVADQAMADVSGGGITITGTAEGGEVLTVTIAQTQLTLSTPPTSVTAYENVSMTYIDGTGGAQYTNVNEDTGETSGKVVITGVDITNRTLSGYFAFTGYKVGDPAAAPVAFYTGSFTNIVYTGTLPAPLTPTPVVVTEYLKAKIDGGDLVEFGMLTAQPASGDMVLSGGTVNPLTSLSISVDEAIVAGTYPFATSPDEGVYGVYNTGGVAYTSTAGSLQIISNTDGIIKGKFNFTGTDSADNTVELTDGEFTFDTN